VYHARTGNNEKALAFFDRAINNNYTLMEAYMEKGFVYYSTQKMPDALKTFETAITVSNTYADAYYWKAKIQEAMGQKDQALLNYERALGLDKQLKQAREAIKRLD
jgi:tetratricopeptide (TPR) repeat protein